MKVFLCVLVFVIALPFQKILAAGGFGPPPLDPLARIDYLDAFNQGDIHRKFMPLMTSMRCLDNVYEGEKTEELELSLEGKSYQQSAELSLYTELKDDRDEKERDADLPIDKQQLKQYRKECLKRLQRARRWAVTEPARETLSTLALITGATTIIVTALGGDSYGGSIGVAVSLYNSVFLVRECIRSAYYLCYTPSHPVDGLERRFALNQCFIPRTLWRPLIKNFMLARQNPFTQQQSMDFIEFTLGLTTYRPRPPVKLIDHPVITEDAIYETLGKLSGEMDTFFKSYNPIAEEAYNTLKMNVLKFVSSLFGKDKQSRYLYLYGPGGIGKTHFALMLRKWVEKAISGIHYEEFIITSPEELEGNPNKPGVFLRVLRNQCLTKKRGSIVVMDEANWLNRPDTISPAKRVFNGGVAKLSTAYFGAGTDGTGVHLDIPPMLVIVSANEEIKDEALRSRFDSINFPMPRADALLAYGRQLFEGSSFVRLAQRRINISSHSEMGLSAFPKTGGRGKIASPKAEGKWSGDDEREFESLAKRLASCTSFREVEAVVPALVGSLLWKKMV